MSRVGTARVYGLRAYDWTRSKLGNCRVGPLVTVPDLWDPFASSLDQTRVFRRAWDCDPSVLLLYATRNPQGMLDWWRGVIQTHGQMDWFLKVRAKGPRAGVLLVIGKQVEVSAAVELKKIFPALCWVLMLNPREPLDFRALDPDFVILGIDATVHARALPLPLEWARSIRDQSRLFWFKSWGGWIPKDQGPASGFYKTEKDGYVRSTVAHVPLLDGRAHKDLPEWFTLPC